MAIRKRKDTNKYQVRIRKKGIDISKSFRSKKQAEQFERQALNEIESGSYGKYDKNITFEELAMLYMQNRIELVCRESTKVDYYGYLKNHLLPLWKHKKVVDISKLDCDNLVKTLANKKCIKVKKVRNGIKAELSSRKLSNKSVNNILTFAKSVFEYGVDSDVLLKNPMRKVKKLPNNTQEANFLTIKECQRLLKFAKEKYPDYYTILYLSIVTGMRQGEALALTWDDIDYDNSVISVTKTLHLGGIGEPKTTASRRNIKIPRTLVLELKKHQLASRQNDKRLVFANEEGNYMDASNLRKRFLYPCLEESNLKRVTWHQLRHSCITALCEGNVPIKCIQKQAGHSSETTTLRIYTHVTEKMENQAIDILEKAFAIPQ